MDHFGRIDILVNNAGQGYYATLEKTDLDVFHHIFDLNLAGPLVAMQQVIPIMRRRGRVRLSTSAPARRSCICRIWECIHLRRELWRPQPDRA